MFKNSFIAIIVATLGLGLSLSVNASSEIKVCAKYKRADYSWSKPYKLTAFKVDGGDLNKATESYKYNSWDNYLFIPWDEGGYTLIKLNSSLEPSIYEREYKDQRSVTWGIKEGWDWCS